jgi:hypothetical protein
MLTPSQLCYTSNALGYSSNNTSFLWPGGERFVQKSLVAFDTDHIKGYVFGTDKLKEIRGASAILDYLNRIVMTQLAKLYQAKKIYAHGGSGLFLIDKDQADEFGQLVQRTYKQETKGAASITYVVQDLPERVTDMNGDDIWESLELMRWHLREAKDRAPKAITLPSHPLMRPCDSCGVEYADAEGPIKPWLRDPGEENALFCASCLRKREEDHKVKNLIESTVMGQSTEYEMYLWDYLISRLRGKYADLTPDTERPQDFNVFRNFKGTKDYFGLIYADANGMGKELEKCRSLPVLQNLALNVDGAIYEAVSTAIIKHLQIKDHLKPAQELDENLDHPVFPFDILLLGGDDVVMVVPASVALDVALTIAEEFHKLTKEKDAEGQGYTLSVGVVLAPIKYPFRLLRGLVDSTLKFAKDEGANQQDQARHQTKYGNTRINFMTVTGSSSEDFKKVYKSLSEKSKHVTGEENGPNFYATLRPYDPEQLELLLELIGDGHELNLGRTKLHQIREAILKKNLTTSVSEGRIVLRNWKPDQREFVVEQVFQFADRYQQQYHDPQNPASLFPRVTFPWFADGKHTYRTPLLDFVELYDFFAREEGQNGTEA